MPSYLTPSEVADRFGVTAATVVTWIERGHLRALNVTAAARPKKKRWRVREDDLAAFEESRRNQGPPAPRRRPVPGVKQYV